MSEQNPIDAVPTLLDTEEWVRRRDAAVARWQADVQRLLIEPLQGKSREN